MLDADPHIARARQDADDAPLLDIDRLSIGYETRRALVPAVRDFSLRVGHGEAMGLVGESGCGKSTVALAIMCDLGRSGRITEGAIRFKGRDLAEMSADELRRLRGGGIAMVYQEPMASLNPAMRVGRQLTEVPMLHEGVGLAEARARAIEMLDAVRLPDPERVMSAYPHQLSGGQQQRIVIAMALLAKPELLLMDEPTTALDVTVEAAIIDLVKGLCDRFGASLLFISHNLGLVLETCDRVTVMYAGEAVETGSIHAVFNQMRHPYTKGLLRSIPLPGADKTKRPLASIPGQPPGPLDRPLGCAFAPRCAHVRTSVCDVAPIEMAGVGGDADHRSRCARIEAIDWDADDAAAASAEPIRLGAPVLRINGLKKHYEVTRSGLFGKLFGGGATRTVKANENITFEAREAETVAIVGESGCGKSTLAKVLLGLETATEGSVTLGDVEIGELAVQDRGSETLASVQMVFQNPFETLNPSHTVGAQIMRTLETFEVGASDEERRARMHALLDLVKLPREYARRMPRQLSGGQKQRIGVARAFAGHPRLVVADEPVSALDVSVQAAVTELLMDIQRKSRTTMLFISHDLSVVRYIADRVVVMYLGHVVESGSTADVFAPPYHPYTEALLSAAPIADTSVVKKRIVLEGEIPSAMTPPPGCPFQTRCQHKALAPAGLCETETPPSRRLADGHEIKCHLAEDILARMDPVIAGA